MSNNNKSVSVWYFKAGESKVLSRKVPVKNGLLDNKKLKEMMGCSNFESYSYTDPSGLCIVMLMNEVGLYEDFVPNIPATLVLKKINYNWGTEVLRGNYIVYAYRIIKDDEDEYQEEKVDMPTKTFPQFIQEWNEAIVRSAKARAEFFKGLAQANK